LKNKKKSEKRTSEVAIGHRKDEHKDIGEGVILKNGIRDGTHAEIKQQKENRTSHHSFRPGKRNHRGAVLPMKSPIWKFKIRRTTNQDDDV